MSGELGRRMESPYLNIPPSRHLGYGVDQDHKILCQLTYETSREDVSGSAMYELSADETLTVGCITAFQ